MLGIENFASFLVTASLVIVVPGPATFYVAGKSQHSTRAAMLAIAGILGGDIVLITLAGLGFASLVSKWPMLLSTIKVGGALYVAYLGISLLRAKPPTEVGASAAVGATTTTSNFLQGVLITLTNPKPILFFAVFFPMFISRTTDSWMRSFYALGGLFEMLSLAYLSAVAVLIMTLRRSTFLGRSSASLTKVSGYCLVACSVLILTSTFTHP